MSAQTPLQPGRFYHVYNRGINGETLFREERNYRYFLSKYAHHVTPVADTYAYCLMPNHFHLLVRIRTRSAGTDGPDDPLTPHRVARCFANLFSGYAKAINNAHSRTGSLFERPFQRIEIDTDRYFQQVVCYIHQNPQRHGFVDDFRTWSHSSYAALHSQSDTRLQRRFVLDHFGGPEAAERAHQDAAKQTAEFVHPAFEAEVGAGS